MELLRGLGLRWSLARVARSSVERITREVCPFKKLAHVVHMCDSETCPALRLLLSRQVDFQSLVDELCDRKVKKLHIEDMHITLSLLDKYRECVGGQEVEHFVLKTVVRAQAVPRPVVLYLSTVRCDGLAVTAVLSCSVSELANFIKCGARVVTSGLDRRRRR